MVRVEDDPRFAAGPQPAGRAPAPGRLGLVQAWVNAFWDLETAAEAWPDPAAFGGWLAARGFSDARRPTSADLEDAVAVREALRDVLLAHHDRDAPEPAAALAVVDGVAAARGPRAGLFPRGDRIDTAQRGVDAALGLLLAVVVEARGDGTWDRLKACPHAHCGWAFYDASKNRSAQWCSMRICGNRTKGERFRARNLKTSVE